MCAATVTLTRYHEFAGDQGGVYITGFGEEGETQNLWLCY